MKKSLLLLWALCLWFSFAFAEMDELLTEEEQGRNINNYEKYQWDPNEILENWFTKEFNNAYNFAYHNGITTMDSIEKADMNGQLNRIAMAKMLSNYLINILKREPDTSKICSFSDVSSELDSQYNNWVTKACQLWIMWIWIEKFRPYDTVTRAEFVTAVWRSLYKIKDWKDIYYTPHLNSLYNIWVIKNNNPKLKELRWYVMIMLMRIAMDWDDPSYRLDQPVQLSWGNWDHDITNHYTIYTNDEYWIKLGLTIEWDWWKIHEEDRHDIFDSHIITFFVEDSTATADVTWIDWYREIFTIRAVTKQVYDDQKDMWNQENITIWHNNKYYFLEERSEEEPWYTDLNIFSI